MTRRFKIWLGLSFVVIFFAGIATGLFAGAMHARHVFMGRHAGMIGERMRAHLRRELSLTPEQYDKVAPIVDQTSAQLEAIRDDTGRRVAETISQSHERIVPLLTPEQRGKLERMRERHRHLMRLHGQFLPPPADGP